MTVGGGSYRTLAFGPGTRYPVVSLEGARDLPPVRGRDLDYSDQHGAATLPDFAGVHTLTLTLGVRGDTHADLESLSEAVRQATPPAAVATELFYRDGTRFRYAKPRRRALPEESEALWRLGQAVVQFDCPDPREYDATLQTGVALLPNAAAQGGMSWPLLWPLTFSGVGSGAGTGQLALVNAGNTDSPLLLRIDGPVVNPTVYHQESGEVLALAITLDLGDFLLIDSEARTVLLNGTASRRSAVVLGSGWPTMIPGANTLRLVGTQGSSPAVNLVTSDTLMDAPSGTVVVRRNVFRNPTAVGSGHSSFGASFPTGTAAGAYLTGQSGWAFGITTAFRTTWSVASSAPGGGILSNQGTNGLAVTPGKVYGAFLQVRCSKVQRVHLRFDWFDAAGVYLSSTAAADVVLAANTVTSLVVTGATAPASAAFVGWVVDGRVGTSGTNWAIGDWIEATHAHVEETDLALAPSGTAFAGTFYGSFAAASYGPLFTYGWAGTVNASASEQRLPALPNYGIAGVAGQLNAQVTEAHQNALAFFVGEAVPFPYATTALLGKWGSAGGATHALARRTISGLTAGQTYTASYWVWVPTGSPDVQLTGSAPLTGPGGGATVTTKDQWVRVSWTFVPTGTSHDVWLIAMTGSVMGDDRVYVTALMVERGGDVLPYSDPNNPRYVPQLTASGRSAWL